jgi:hypothetical protein
MAWQDRIAKKIERIGRFMILDYAILGDSFLQFPIRTLS